MTKKITEKDLIEYPFEADQQFGRGYLMRNFTTRAGGFEQRQYFKVWYRALKTIAMSTIKWDGMPAGIDPRAVEYILLHFGSGAMFEESGGLLFAQATFADMINMYYNPNEVMLSAPSGQYWYRHAQPWGDPATGAIHDADCAMCWDNMLREPLLPIIRTYAQRIARYDYVMDMNVDAQLTPWVIVANAEKVKQRNKMRSKLERQDQYWEVTQEGAEELPYVMQTGAEFTADRIQALKMVLINEVLTILGVDNTNVNKKERVQTAEVLSNNEMIMACRESRLKARQLFCDAANVAFAYHGFIDNPLSVEWGIEGSIADIAAAMTGGGFASIMQALAAQEGGAGNEPA